MPVIQEKSINSRVYALVDSITNVAHVQAPIGGNEHMYTHGKPDNEYSDKSFVVEQCPGNSVLLYPGQRKKKLPGLYSQRFHNVVNEYLLGSCPEGLIIAFEVDSRKFSVQKMKRKFQHGLKFHHPLGGTQIFHFAFYTQNSKSGVTYWVNEPIYDPYILNLHETIGFAEDMTRSGLIFSQGGRGIYYSSLTEVQGIPGSYVLQGHVDPSDIRRQIEDGTAYCLGDGTGLMRQSHFDVCQETQNQYPFEVIITQGEWRGTTKRKIAPSVIETLDCVPGTLFYEELLYNQKLQLMRLRAMSPGQLSEYLMSSLQNKETEEFTNFEWNTAYQFLSTLQDIEELDDATFQYVARHPALNDGLIHAAKAEFAEQIFYAGNSEMGIIYPVFSEPDTQKFDVYANPDIYPDLHDEAQTFFFRYPIPADTSVVPVRIRTSGGQAEHLKNKQLVQFRCVSTSDDFSQIHWVTKGTKTLVPDSVLNECTLVTPKGYYHFSDIDIISCTEDTKVRTKHICPQWSEQEDICILQLPGTVLTITNVIPKGMLLGVPEVQYA